MTTAVVVGSGPNGLAAAIVLARAGWDVTVLEANDTIGGGMRSAELTVPGLVHDVCSAAHPTGVASPFLQSLQLDQHGLEWAWADVEAAHPLDDGRVGLLYRDLDRTAAALGPDGSAWRSLFGGLTPHVDDLAADIFGPVLGVPDHPLTFGRFGVRSLLPATWTTRRWRDEAAALFAGMAAHTFQRLDRPLGSALGMMFGLLGHTYGWPVAVGGSQSIANALVSVLTAAGGRIETGHRVTTLPAADVVMLDVTPEQVLTIVGDRLPPRVARGLRGWRRGPAAFKVDLAIEGGIPWTRPEVAGAATVHLGGTMAQINAAEVAVGRGRMPEQPFVLLCQQYVADPSRSVGDVHPIWAYAHVPHGFDGDATPALLAQIERFAPGVRDRVVAMSVHRPADLEAGNANYVGGDITAGAATPWQTIARPRLTARPYSLGVPGVYLCSASTPPGGGVHGMAGFHAATQALRERM
ncbi:MAG TPA: NAD(P)/FAD-dependent oxidoreductase [Aeromicrobium sp.]|nr:NAD(P)/FAD-dependent oxidoreductase [Aeromicrobium sp.]